MEVDVGTDKFFFPPAKNATDAGRINRAMQASRTLTAFTSAGAPMRYLIDSFYTSKYLSNITFSYHLIKSLSNRCCSSFGLLLQNYTADTSIIKLTSLFQLVFELYERTLNLLLKIANPTVTLFRPERLIAR
jgi:hypothetical protein